MKNQVYKIPQGCVAIRFTQAGVEAIAEAKELYGVTSGVMQTTLRLRSDHYVALIVFRVPETRLEKLSSIGDAACGVTVFAHPQSLWVSARQSADPEEITEIPRWLLTWLTGAE